MEEIVMIAAGITNLNQHISMAAMSAKKEKTQQNLFAETNRKTDTVSLRFQKINDEDKAKRYGQIIGKLKSGIKLSHADMEFLREHFPADYEKAVKVAKEREAYRRALENAKTKDEVQMLQTQKMNQMSGEMKAAKDAKDGDTMLLVEYKLAAVINEIANFLKSEEYDKLKYQFEIIREKMNEKEEKIKGEDSKGIDVEIDIETDEFMKNDKIKDRDSSSPPEEIDNEKTDIYQPKTNKFAQSFSSV
jgi:hypothetical protein